MLVEELDGGLVVYDAATSQAHSLDPVAARVWRVCDGARTVSDIARAVGLDRATAEAVIVRLGEIGLLEPASGGISRRVMLYRSARVGVAAAAAAPVISTVLIPTAAAHASTIGGTTSPGSTNAGPGSAQLTVTGKTGSGPFSYSVSGGTQPAQSGTFDVGKVLEFDPYGNVIDPMTADPGYVGVRFNSDGSFDLANQAAQPVYWAFTDSTDVTQSRGYTTVAPGGSVNHPVPTGESFVLSATFVPQSSAPPATVTITATYDNFDFQVVIAGASPGTYYGVYGDQYQYSTDATGGSIYIAGPPNFPSPSDAPSYPAGMVLLIENRSSDGATFTYTDPVRNQTYTLAPGEHGYVELNANISTQASVVITQV